MLMFALLCEKYCLVRYVETGWVTGSGLGDGICFVGRYLGSPMDASTLSWHHLDLGLVATRASNTTHSMRDRISILPSKRTFGPYVAAGCRDGKREKTGGYATADYHWTEHDTDRCVCICANS
jgi:hypothetical protein